MRFQCANCKHVLRADNDKAGAATTCEECGCVVAVPPHRYAPGVVIGDFRVFSKIGEGAIGTVYYSHQISLDRPAALKILRNQFAENVNYRERFLQEARTAAKLNHPGIVQAYAVGEEDGDYYFAMEYVEGSTLKKVLAHSGSVMTQRAVAIVKQISEALEFAWTNAKLVHRDIKPDNIILTEDGQAKLADLGLAKIGGDFLNEDAENVFGTPQYIAPEQLMGEPVDCRTDIYSLGATFYQLVTGRYPYTGTDPGDISRKHLYETLTPPNKLVPEIPESISLLIQIMMAKRPENRYQTPHELLEDLWNVERGKHLNRELPADSQRLFSPEEVEGDNGGGRGADGAAKTGAGGKRKLKVSRTRRAGAAARTTQAAQADGGEAGEGTGGKTKLKVSRDAKPPADAASAEDGTGEAREKGPFRTPAEATAGAPGKKGGKSLVVALVVVLLAVAVGGGGYWYYTQQQQEDDSVVENGEEGQTDGLLPEVKSLVAAGSGDEALRLVQAYANSEDADPVKVARLREAVDATLEAEVRQLRSPRIREQRKEWTERSEALVEQARIEAELMRDRLAAERIREEKEKRERLAREREERRLAELRDQQREVRRKVVARCREREYSRALLATAALRTVEEQTFAEWAKAMEKTVQMAKNCFETVSGSDELLKGFNCQPGNWVDSKNVVALQVNYISSNSIILRYNRKVYDEEGVFKGREAGVANVKFEDVRPAAMGRLLDAAWRRSNKGSLIQRDLHFAAYLVCEARALDIAQKRLEGASGAEADFLQQELGAMRELGL